MGRLAIRDFGVTTIVISPWSSPTPTPAPPPSSSPTSPTISPAPLTPSTSTPATPTTQATRSSTTQTSPSPHSTPASDSPIASTQAQSNPSSRSTDAASSSSSFQTTIGALNTVPQPDQTLISSSSAGEITARPSATEIASRPKPLSVATIVAVTVATVGILTLLLFLVVHIYRRRARKAALMAISRFTLPALTPSANSASPAAAPTGNASRAGTRSKALEAEPLFPPSHSVTEAGSFAGDAELPALRGRGSELEIDTTRGDRGAAESEAPPPSYYARE